MRYSAKHCIYPYLPKLAQNWTANGLAYECVFLTQEWQGIQGRARDILPFLTQTSLLLT